MASLKPRAATTKARSSTWHVPIGDALTIHTLLLFVYPWAQRRSQGLVPCGLRCRASNAYQQACLPTKEKSSIFSLKYLLHMSAALNSPRIQSLEHKWQVSQWGAGLWGRPGTRLGQRTPKIVGDVIPTITNRSPTQTRAASSSRTEAARSLQPFCRIFRTGLLNSAQLEEAPFQTKCSPLNTPSNCVRLILNHFFSCR